MDITCKTCSLTKPKRDFRRLATLAQSRALTHNPESQKRITITSATCNKCHNKARRKPTELTPEELRKRLINEGAPIHYAHQVYEERLRCGKQRRQESGKRAARSMRWDTYTPLLQEVASLNLIVRTRQRYAAKRIKHADPNYADTPSFLQTCLGQLVLARGVIRRQRAAGRGAPARWRDLINADLIRGAYAQMGEGSRRRYLNLLGTLVPSLTGDSITQTTEGELHEG